MCAMLLQEGMYRTKILCVKAQRSPLSESLADKSPSSFGVVTRSVADESLCDISYHPNRLSLETCCSLSRCEAARAAVRRGIGLDVRTGTTIATPRAGARTTSQTTYVFLWKPKRAFGWVFVAHPSVLLDLLRCHSVALTRRVSWHRLAHHPRR